MMKTMNLQLVAPYSGDTCYLLFYYDLMLTSFLYSLWTNVYCLVWFPFTGQTPVWFPCKGQAGLLVMVICRHYRTYEGPEWWFHLPRPPQDISDLYIFATLI